MGKSICAIFGAKTLTKFKELYELNLQRGDSAYGLVLINNNKKAFIFKGEGRATKALNIIPDRNGFIYYTGHTQAPTSSAQIYNCKTSHPFVYGDWIVSHNGVITNFEELSKEVPPESINVVDSSIIPALLSIKNNRSLLVGKILDTLSKIKGTHSTTIYNRRCDVLCIARCGSTLFIDDKGNYSSTEFENSKPVSDGSLMHYRFGGFEEAGKFINNSPFFII